MTPEREQELLKALADGVVNYDEEGIVETVNIALEEKLDPHKAVFDGLVVGMQECGRLYEEQEYFVPELLMCADAMYAGLHILRPLLKGDEANARVKGQVVMGVVQGDVHDIGKNIVKMMFDAAGFTVHDLGRDVPLEKFVEEQLKTDSEIVALSAMMTTTMVGMKDIIKQIKEKNPKAKIMIGGAPVTEEIAGKWGADGYAPNASNALQDAINMVSSLKDIS
ncbi:methyltransferase cognate corrinoid proteins [Desulfotomaculum arcticum]|uniref:Methyltransferase cognate corrinoid proteins n=1 Tax=Desulfotruncus arcticus DSM 17038 TaxID=1121424 RepID=A0A1I2QDX2_9FIRM|nr:methyltransferase cognate corrinoid proteins [Desulfotomaculum arcticum] [Desulfotruncus arcticus DSM 17038]